MGMYDVQEESYAPVRVFAGDYPVVTDVGTVKTGVTARKLTPLITTVDGITEATAAGIADLCGIAAAESADSSVVYYLTGEFFADALTLPDGVTVAAMKPIFRKLGIFLK